MKRSGSGRVARKIGSYDNDSAESENRSQSDAPKSAGESTQLQFSELLSNF